MNLVWNDEEIGIRSMGHCFIQFRYGSIFQKDSPLPGVILIEEKSYK